MVGRHSQSPLLLCACWHGGVSSLLLRPAHWTPRGWQQLPDCTGCTGRCCAKLYLGKGCASRMCVLLPLSGPWAVCRPRGCVSSTWLSWDAKYRASPFTVSGRFHCQRCISCWCWWCVWCALCFLAELASARAELRSRVCAASELCVIHALCWIPEVGWLVSA